MFAAAFHPRGRNGPDLFCQIDLIPARADDFSGAGCGQNCKLESKRCDTILSAQRLDELSGLIIRQSRVMLYFGNLAARRQQIVEVAFPQRRIFAGPIAACFGPIENRLDSSELVLRFLASSSISVRGPS